MHRLNIYKNGRPIKVKRLMYKTELLHDYIKDTDTIYREDIERIGLNNVDLSLQKYAKKHGIRIERIDYKTFDVIR